MAARVISDPAPTFQRQPRSAYGEKIERIGNGTYGKVYRTRLGYASKIIQVPGQLEWVHLNEIVYPSSLTHPGIIRYLDVYLSKDTVEIIMPLFNGDLSSLRDSRYLFGSIAAQLISSVAHLESRNILHRDIKPENIFYRLCDRGGVQCVLGDFGISVGWVCTSKLTDTDVYSLNYRPPEILAEITPYTSVSDVWAYACTMYWVYTNQILFDGSSIAEMLALMVNRLGPPPIDSIVYNPVLNLIRKDRSSYSQSRQKLVQKLDALDRFYDPQEELKFPEIDDPEIRDFLLRCLDWDPTRRMSAQEALQHPLIQRYSNSIPGCFQFQPVPAITCIDRPHRFERHFDLGASAIEPSASDLGGSWMMEVVREWELSPAVAILAQTLFHRILGLEIIPRGQYQLIICVSLWIATAFRAQINLSIDDFVYLTAKTYTQKEIRTAVDIWLSRLNFDLLAATPHDYLSSYSGQIDNSLLKSALDSLMIIAPIKDIFTRPNIVKICFQMAHGVINSDDLLKIQTFYRGFGSSLATGKTSITKRIRSYLNSSIEDLRI